MKKVVLFLLAAVIINVAWSEELIIDDLESGLDLWKLVMDHGATAETSTFAWNGTYSLHYYNYDDYGDRFEKNYTISASNLENYIVSVWFYSNNSYTNIDLYLIDNSGVECSNSINVGSPTGSWIYFRKRIGDFEKCDYQSLVSIDRIQFYIGEIPADIYIDELRVETSDVPLSDDGGSPGYEKGKIFFSNFTSEKDVLQRGESSLFECQLYCESGCNYVVLNVESQYLMSRVQGNEINGIYRYTWLAGSGVGGDYNPYVRAVDLGGNSSESYRVNLSVDPKLSVSLKTQNSLSLGEGLWINGSVFDLYGDKHTANLGIDIGGFDSVNTSISGDFSLIYDTSEIQAGLLTVTVTAVDSANNSGSNSSEVVVMSGEESGVRIIITSPTSPSVYRGQTVRISADVTANDSFWSGASVNTSFCGVTIPLPESAPYYEADYVIPWDAELGGENLVILARKGDVLASNMTTIDILEEDIQSGLIDGGIIGFSSTITINLTFPDNTPLTNASIIGVIGKKNLTFVEIGPGVYSATYVPEENDTDITIHVPGGTTIVMDILLRLPGLIDYLNLFKFHIMFIALIITVVFVAVRRYFGL